MDKKAKDKLREAGWTEEEIIELEMEEKVVTISKERYEELLQKEESLAEIREMTDEETHGEYGSFDYKGSKEEEKDADRNRKNKSNTV